MDPVKITEIKEYYNVKRREKDTSGQTVTVEKTLYKYKEVPYVDGWPRFGHYILDYLVFQVFCMVVGAGIGIVLVLTGYPHLLQSEEFNRFSWILTWLVLYPGYYILCESAMQSSPGKLILKRVVVNEYGEKPVFRQVLIRSFSRIVPFEAFSCFDATGWHDNWSKTYVLRKKDLEELRLQTMVENFDAVHEAALPESAMQEEKQ